MNGLDYIESYFDGTLDVVERELFEQRIQTDEAFAKEVAFFVAARDELQNTLRDQKISAWEAAASDNIKAINNTTVPVRSVVNWKKVLSYAAAAIVIGMGIWIGIRPDEMGTYQMADEYINKELSTLSQTMDGGQDSLQQGIALYNSRHYKRAASVFESLYLSDTNNVQALKFAGLTNLADENYEAALQQFDRLAAKTNLFANPGHFYSAVTLMKRNAPGDKESARQLLDQVVKEKQEGSEQAEKWLQAF